MLWKNDRTVNNFYFARSIAELVKEGRDNALASLSPENSFIFSSDEMTDWKKYNLHYYAIDGIIVGYVDPIEGFDEINIDD